MNPSDNGEDNDWSDRICNEAANKDFFPSAVRNIAVQKSIVTKFLNFYLGGKIQKGLNVTDIVFAAISIMPLHEDTEQFIWQDLHYHDNGTLFFLTPEDKLKAVIDHTSKDKAPDQINEPSKDKLAATLEEKEVKKAAETPDNINDDTKEQNTKDVHSIPYEPENKHEISKNGASSASGEKEDQEKKQADDGPNVKRNEPGIQQSRQKHEGSQNEFPNFNGTIKWLGNKTKTVEKDKRIEYGPVENAAFVKSCNKLLEEWDTNTKARIILKYFFGVVGLTFMRGTTKSYMHLVNTFSGHRFRMKAINRVESYLKYSTPHKKCIKSCYRRFNRKEGAVRLMFAKIVVNSLVIDDVYLHNPDIIQWNIFKITVLAHTGDYGFGLVSMLRTLLSKIPSGLGINAIIKVTYCNDTQNSWERLVNFFNKYMSETSKESTHHWARIIDPCCFKNLTCPDNYPLAVILAVFLEKETKDDGIWKSTWVLHEDVNTQTYKELGYEMHIKYKRLEKETFDELLSDTPSLKRNKKTTDTGNSTTKTKPRSNFRMQFTTMNAYHEQDLFENLDDLTTEIDTVSEDLGMDFDVSSTYDYEYDMEDDFGNNNDFGDSWFD